MPEPSVKELLASAGMAFTGTVEAVRATTVPDIPVNDRTVIVGVAETLHAPEEMQLPSASRVTVQLSADLPPLDVGDQAAFFANGLVYGESLAVTEVGRTGIEQTAWPVAQLAGVKLPVTPVHFAFAGPAAAAVAAL